MSQYDFFTFPDLMEELRKQAVSYSIIVTRHNEDVGINKIETITSFYETNRMQSLGIASKLYNWQKSKIQIQPVDPNPAAVAVASNTVSNEEQNSEGKIIIEVIAQRCISGVMGVIFNDGELYCKNWEKFKGQSLGLSDELLARALSKF